jgi:hypothetical protein
MDTKTGEEKATNVDEEPGEPFMIGKSVRKRIM